ncbi:uncharacterized protein N7459_003662 [Penicillium hispanicum]|uniref:uncharacterized protein n=1 Tax=Penicillium hispanicum TaxID=1080232 RepID=UPI0025410981|nr:uncharacterized protein N7459_003662 [Penicillium hispanicum]KAJ5587897.1 hypothetical protein N7459_003662 [Penicillium hispanicum]
MSSDEEAVRRPGRGTGANGMQSPARSDSQHDSDAGNKSPFGADGDQMDEDNDADLFGSDGEEGGLENLEYATLLELQIAQNTNQASSRGHRTLDDERLDSGDDEDRYDRRGDRMDEVADEEHVAEELNIMDVDLARAPIPMTNDGQVYTMRIPEFLSIESEEFNPETYVAPPYSTAATSLCWRKAPNDESQLQSNARMIQWEDGSITLQLASAPLEQYRIQSKPLAPLSKSGDYDTKLDSHVYLGAAAETAMMFRLTSHVTHGLTVLPTTLETDDAVQKLQESLAAASRGSKQTADGSAPVIDMREDPELAQRKAEHMEKEAIKAERRRQMLADREADRDRGRRAAPRPLQTGLSVGGLEDDGLLTTRPRGKPRRTNRRGEINTDDEDDYGRGRTREDEYDEDDGFLVGSDEDVEEEAEDDEEELEDEDMDAEGEADEEVAPAKPTRKLDAETPRSGTPPARKKNRYVVDDEDEDE